MLVQFNGVEMKSSHSLFEAFLVLKTPKDVEMFLKDLCTPAELKAMKERWLVCNELNYSDLSYREIGKKLGVSLTTIGRVARFLREEKNFGYQTVFKELKK